MINKDSIIRPMNTRRNVATFFGSLNNFFLILLGGLSIYKASLLEIVVYLLYLHFNRNTAKKFILTNPNTMQDENPY